MELAIIAGIGLVGYHMARGGAEARPGADERKSERRRVGVYPAPAGGDAARQVRRYEHAARRRWTQSLQPHLTGIVSPTTARDAAAGAMPFFRSARTQHTNDGMKQRRMELFTGAVNDQTSATGTWRHKTEVQQAHPQNATPLTSSGTAGNPLATADASRFIPADKHNNVSPVPQVRVGPGLGLDPNQDATDGFHPMVRVLPINVGEYKKNNLPGSANHGFSGVTRATRRQAVAKNRPDKPMATECNRNQEPGRAVYTAPTAQPDPARHAVGRLAGHFYTGGPGSTGAVSQGGHLAQTLQEGRDKPDHYVSTPAMNVHDPSSGVGTYVVGSFDDHRIRAQQREQTGGFGFLQPAGVQARSAAAGVIVPPTQRDMTRLDGLAHASAKPVTQNTQTRPMHAPQTTLKQQLVGGGQVLNLGSVTAKATSGPNAQRQYLDKHAKRGDQVVGFAPHPGRMNVFESVLSGKTRMRDDDTRQGCLPSHGVMQSSTRSAAAVGTLTSNYNKLQPGNPHAETLDIARRQLAANDFAIPAFSG